MGQSPRLRLMDVYIDQIDKLHVLGGASWGRSPPPPPPPKGERPKCYSRLDMNLGDVSSRKCWKGVRRPAVKTRKIRGPQKKKKIMK